MDDLPSLNALRVFEAVARLMSFTKAAEELCVTQGAVSRQVRNLEEELGLPLLIRQPNNLALTRDGEKLFHAAASAFAQIREARRAIREKTATLKIICAPTIATRWLIPRIYRFHEENPTLQLQLSTSVSLIDFRQYTDFDAAITYGEPINGEGLIADPLFREILFPACAPQLLSSGRPLETYADLSRHTLLHSSLERVWWKAWAKKAGIARLKSAGDTCFELEESMIQAVRVGSGVSLVNIYFVQEEIASGELVYPFPDAPALPMNNYYLAVPRTKASRQALKKFRDWVMAEIADLLDRAVIPGG